MELRKLTPADMQQVRSVWKECFGDSDSFLDAYFAACVNIADGLGFFDSGRLVSSMFTYRINVNISGMVYQSQFIAGCGTLPEARNQHLMRSLIHSALTDMASRNICLCFLHPFLHSFYRKFGFETIAYVSRMQSAAAAAPSVKTASSMSELPFDSIHASYAAYVTQFGSYFIRSKSRMQAWLQLLFEDGGKAVYIDGSDSTPYALYYDKRDDQGNVRSEIFELVYFRPEQLAALTGGTGCPSSYFLPAARPPESGAGREGTEFTMMRVLDPQVMLGAYQYPAGTQPFVINIHDAFLGCDYNLQVSPQGSSAAVSPSAAPADIVTDVGGLAQLFTGTYLPKDFPAAVPYFASGSSCFFETY